MRAFEGQQYFPDAVGVGDMPHGLAFHLAEDVFQVGGGAGFADAHLHGVGADAADKVEAVMRGGRDACPFDTLHKNHYLLRVQLADVHVAQGGQDVAVKLAAHFEAVLVAPCPRLRHILKPLCGHRGKGSRGVNARFFLRLLPCGIWVNPLCQQRLLFRCQRSRLFQAYRRINAQAGGLLFAAKAVGQTPVFAFTDNVQIKAAAVGVFAFFRHGFTVTVCKRCLHIPVMARLPACLVGIRNGHAVAGIIDTNKNTNKLSALGGYFLIAREGKYCDKWRFLQAKRKPLIEADK